MGRPSKKLKRRKTLGDAGNAPYPVKVDYVAHLKNGLTIVELFPLSLWGRGVFWTVPHIR